MECPAEDSMPSYKGQTSAPLPLSVSDAGSPGKHINKNKAVAE